MDAKLKAPAHSSRRFFYVVHPTGRTHLRVKALFGRPIGRRYGRVQPFWKNT